MFSCFLNFFFPPKGFNSKCKPSSFNELVASVWERYSKGSWRWQERSSMTVPTCFHLRFWMLPWSDALRGSWVEQTQTCFLNLVFGMCFQRSFTNFGVTFHWTVALMPLGTSILRWRRFWHWRTQPTRLPSQHAGRSTSQQWQSQLQMNPACTLAEFVGALF